MPSQVTLGGRAARAWHDSGWFSVKTDVLPPLAVGIAAYVLAQDQEGSTSTALIVSVAAGFMVLVIVHAAHYAWNFARAGDRLALEEAQITIAGLHRQVQDEQRWRLEMEAKMPTKLSDEEIIASLSERTKELLLSGFGKQLAQGDLSARTFDDYVVAELQEYGLATIVYGTPGPRSLARGAIAYLNLAGDGSRILRKMRSG